MQVNFDLDESDMRVFSDEDTNHIFSNRSSMEHLQNVTTNNVSLKYLSILLFLLEIYAFKVNNYNRS